MWDKRKYLKPQGYWIGECVILVNMKEVHMVGRNKYRSSMLEEPEEPGERKKETNKNVLRLFRQGFDQVRERKD